MQQQSGNFERVLDKEGFTTMAGVSPLMIWISGPYEFCSFANRRWLSFQERIMEREQGEGAFEIYPDDLELSQRAHQSAFIRRREFLVEYRVRRSDGRYRWILDKGMPFFEGDGQFAGYMGACIDITSRKEAEEELTRSEQRYRSVVEDQTELICRFVPDGTITFVNDACRDYFSESRGDIVGKSFWRFIPSDEQQRLREHLASVSPQRPVAVIEYQVGNGDSSRWQQWSHRGIFDVSGVVVEFQSVGRDVTEQKEAERALVESEARFRAIFERNLVPLAYWHADGYITDANDAYLRLVGYSREDLRSGGIRWDRMAPIQDMRLKERALKAWESGRDCAPPFESHYRRKDGGIVPVLVGDSLLPGFKDRGVKFAVDLSEQKHLESELRKQKALSSAIISSLPGHVAVIDAGGRIIAVNESWVRFAARGAGAEDKVDIGANYFGVCAKALRCRDATAQEALEGIQSVLTGGRPDFLLQYQCASMPPQWFQMRVEPLRRPEGGAVISHVDVTNQVKAEIEAHNHRLELAHVARVTLLGEITGSITHELNQPLTAILSNAQAGQRLLQGKKRSHAEIPSILADIAADGKRAAEVISRLRSLLGKGELEKQPVDVNALIEQTLQLVRSEMIIRHIAVEKQFDAALPPVLGDRIQLQQVILNLVINAAEAMAGCPPTERKLVLATFPTEGKIAIKVRDFGPGLDPKDRDQIFEPFFTTKVDGMGVGLWINRAIVDAHGGELLAANNDDKGATFHVMLPAHRVGDV